MNSNRIVRVRVSVKKIRELLGLQDNGFDKHRGLPPEDARRRKTFTGHSAERCDGFYHFNDKGVV